MKKRLFPVYLVIALALAACSTNHDSAPTPTPTPTGPDPDGIVMLESEHDLETTFDRLVSALEENHRITVFETVDHSANANGVDLDLPGTRLIVFGNPNLGTRLMQQARTVAIDLPQKYLVWEDETGVWIGWNDPRYLARRHGIDASQKTIKTISDVLRKTATVAARR